MNIKKIRLATIFIFVLTGFQPTCTAMEKYSAEMVTVLTEKITELATDIAHIHMAAGRNFSLPSDPTISIIFDTEDELEVQNPGYNAKRSRANYYHNLKEQIITLVIYKKALEKKLEALNRNMVH
jgi:hypothetical protein